MARQQGFYIGTVEGVGPALAALEEFKPKLYDELVDRMRGVAEDVAKRVNASMPNDPPMSGFNHAGGSSWANKGEAKAIEEKSRYTQVEEWPVYRISLSGWAGAMTDIAGAASRGVTPQGVNMVAVLNSRYGRASRWIWPVAEAAAGRVERDMKKGCEKVEEALSRKLAANAPAGTV